MGNGQTQSVPDAPAGGESVLLAGISRPLQACRGLDFPGFVACWWLYMRVIMGLHWSEESLSLTTALMLNSVLKLWIASKRQRLAEEQQMGSLELLLSTPLSTRAIVRGQFLALKRQFLMPLAVVIGVEVVFMVACHSPRSSPPERGKAGRVWGDRHYPACFGHHGPNLGCFCQQR